MAVIRDKSTGIGNVIARILITFAFVKGGVHCMPRDTDVRQIDCIPIADSDYAICRANMTLAYKSIDEEVRAECENRQISLKENPYNMEWLAIHRPYKGQYTQSACLNLVRLDMNGCWDRDAWIRGSFMLTATQFGMTHLCKDRGKHLAEFLKDKDCWEKKNQCIKAMIKSPPRFGHKHGCRGFENKLRECKRSGPVCKDATFPIIDGFFTQVYANSPCSAATLNLRRIFNVLLSTYFVITIQYYSFH